MTGNVMVDGRALGEPGNVVVEDERDMEMLQKWASAMHAEGALVYMQLNHPGRQAPKFINEEAVAPSAVPMKPDYAPYFPPPRPLTHDEILDVIERFATAAEVAQKAGFDGVQIHGAHGYLVSQFLSPLTNQRTDAWGGSPEHRRRFPIEIVRAIRKRTGGDYPVAIKINSADFQRGGFTEEESLAAIEALVAQGLQFVEVSGGTYEAPEMMNVKQSTRQREAYFLEFAEKLRDVVDVPLAVTGGFRTAAGMAQAIDSGAVDLCGMARPLAVHPDFPSQLVTDPDAAVEIKPRKTGIGLIDRAGMLETVWYERQLQLMGAGKDPNPDEWPLKTMIAHGVRAGLKGFKTRRGR
jgi:2,4-dienoyl-CoA reductase-like NADH-dependent reductase (Old Yellow Enzyme family)